MESKKTINLGGQIFEIEVNFKKSYELTKFRNKMTYGIDFSDADKEVIAEIAKIQADAQNGVEINLEALSPETIEYLNKLSNNKQELFNMDELIEIGKILTGVEKEEELIELYDKEVEENGYDVLISKLTLGISTVFMNAKSTSLESKEIKAKNEVA